MLKDKEKNLESSKRKMTHDREGDVNMINS